MILQHIYMTRFRPACINSVLTFLTATVITDSSSLHKWTANWT